MTISKPPQKKAVQDAAFDKFIDQIDDRPGRRTIRISLLDVFLTSKTSMKQVS